MTNCLRLGDVTLFRNDGSRETIEVKSNPQRSRTVSSALDTTPHRRRYLHMPANDELAQFREPGALWEEAKELHQLLVARKQEDGSGQTRIGDRLSTYAKAQQALSKNELPPLVPAEIQELIPDIPYEFLEIGTPRFQILLETIAAIQAGHISPTNARLTPAEPPENPPVPHQSLRIIQVTGSTSRLMMSMPRNQTTITRQFLNLTSSTSKTVMSPATMITKTIETIFTLALSMTLRKLLQLITRNSLTKSSTTTSIFG
jgi:hypothetical protein